MGSDVEHKKFPTGTAFLDLTQSISDECSKKTDAFFGKGGKKLPATMDALGNVLSMLYRSATCAWGCKGGDHQVEWLCGRLVNQSMSALRLIRCASYDEALMLIRGVGEIANLLWLFMLDANEMETWKRSNKSTRKNQFGPVKVRLKLERLTPKFVPIDNARYEALCEIGTHPVPAFRPGQYNDHERPTLGMLMQELGVFVTTAELAYAVGMSATPFARLLSLPADEDRYLKDQSVALVEAIGGIDITSLDEVMANLKEKRAMLEKPAGSA